MFLGDSTLDNVVWVAGRGRPVRDHLIELSGPGMTVVNLAADGFTTGHVLHGGPATISAAARSEAGDPVPGDVMKFTPLTHLAALPGARDATVVLSVGGNDVREILGAMHHLTTRLEKLWQNYPKIVSSVLGVSPRLVLMLQYGPAFGADKHYGVYRAMETIPGPGDGLQKLFGLFEMVYPPILELARVHRLPIVDLPRTFDVHDATLYRSQIEPSDKVQFAADAWLRSLSQPHAFCCLRLQGGRLIASLLKHVLEHHDFEGGTSQFYYLPPGGSGVVVEANDGAKAWKVKPT